MFLNGDNTNNKNDCNVSCAYSFRITLFIGFSLLLVINTDDEFYRNEQVVMWKWCRRPLSISEITITSTDFGHTQKCSLTCKNIVPLPKEAMPYVCETYLHKNVQLLKEKDKGRCVLDFAYYVYLLTELSRRKQYQKTNDLALVYGLVCLGVIKIGGMIINFFFEKYLRNLDSTAEHRSKKSIITVYVDAVSLEKRGKKQTNKSI